MTCGTTSMNNIYKKEIEPAGQFLEKMEITAIA